MHEMGKKGGTTFQNADELLRRRDILEFGSDLLSQLF